MMRREQQHSQYSHYSNQPPYHPNSYHAGAGFPPHPSSQPSSSPPSNYQSNGPCARCQKTNHKTEGKGKSYELSKKTKDSNTNRNENTTTEHNRCSRNNYNTDDNHQQ